MNCDICYLEKLNSDFYTCTRCRNKHCNDCNTHLTKCPFCRLVIKDEDEKEFEIGLMMRLTQLQNDDFNVLSNICIYLNRHLHIYNRVKYANIRRMILNELNRLVESNDNIYRLLNLIN